MFRLFRGIRLLAFTLGGGIALIHSGWNDLVLRHGTSASPVEVSIEQVEAGHLPDSPFWRIGEHVAVTSVGVFQYSRHRGEKAEPTAKSAVQFYYYPIISTRHPILAGASSLRDQSVSLERAAMTAAPAFEDFTVLVKTHRFATVGALPTRATKEAKIQGMAINRVARLSDKERKEFATLFPHLDLDKLVIFEEGRSPAAGSRPYAAIVAGCAVCLVWPVGIYISSRRRLSQSEVLPGQPARIFA